MPEYKAYKVFSEVIGPLLNHGALCYRFINYRTFLLHEPQFPTALSTVIVEIRAERHN
jgi:hypothetical protein